MIFFIDDLKREGKMIFERIKTIKLDNIHSRSRSELLR